MLMPYGIGTETLFEKFYFELKLTIIALGGVIEPKLSTVYGGSKS